MSRKTDQGTRNTALVVDTASTGLSAGMWMLIACSGLAWLLGAGDFLTFGI